MNTPAETLGDAAREAREEHEQKLMEDKEIELKKKLSDPDFPNDSETTPEPSRLPDPATGHLRLD